MRNRRNRQNAKTWRPTRTLVSSLYRYFFLGRTQCLLSLILVNQKKRFVRHEFIDLSHLGDVISLLKRCSFPKTRWSDLGLLLGLLKTSLDAIKQDNASMDSRLMECLSLWLNRVDNVDRRGQPTFNSLSLALREMEENSVADALDKESKLRVWFVGIIHL